ncbi:MAG TPA: hypothetical protein VHY81_08135 [Acidimicrobiales bacterium]|nr:hypothetical protein [Acidimicrobiales bacterium]
MKDSRLNRWMWLIGLAAVALIFVSFGPLGSGAPGENASGVAVANWYNTHVNQSWITIWLVGAALFLLLVFVTQLRAVLVEAGGQRLLPNIVFAAGIMLVAGMIVAGALHMIVIVSAHNHEYAVTHFINFMDSNDELLFLAGMVFLTLSTGLAILLNREVAPLPKRLGWYSLLVAVVGSAGPLSFLAFLFGFPVWILATGIVIAVKQSRGTLGGDAGPGGGATVSVAQSQPVAA